MSKKALCVGINDYPYGEENDLRGCLNDAHGWAQLLKTHFGFTDVKLLLDAQATKANILAGLKDLLAGAKAGDVLVFTNASHGTYVADKDGDEPKYDEAICPYDVDKNLIIDDELRVLFAGLPKGVSLTVISDSCHSGSVTRAVVGDTPDQRRHRFLHPSLRGAKALSTAELKAADKKKEKYPEEGMNEILLSGCKSNQYSSDATIDGQPHGAMTYYAIKAITEANYQLTYEELLAQLVPALDEEGYDQVPQLEGKALHKQKQIFT
ncbi:MAG: caspase family protein [Acidobacteria bacterium]|nr:caspase family protein [Acidobacteriota bacterium]MBI3425088.1 caspase family protein [Acidobacteriota bacterium]